MHGIVILTTDMEGLPCVGSISAPEEMPGDAARDLIAEMLRDTTTPEGLWDHEAAIERFGPRGLVIGVEW